MEAFSLLKYWRGGGATVDGSANVRNATTTIVTAVSHHAAGSTDEDDEDDGPFFDLEFTVPDEDDGDEPEKNEDNGCANCMDDGDEEREVDIESDGTDGENEREFKFTLSSGSSGDRTDPNVSLSPSDDLFFKGRLVPIEPSSIVFNGSEPNSKSHQFSLLKSATKFRVLMLKFKKSKSNVAEKTEPPHNGSSSVTEKQQQKQEEPQQQQKQQQNQSQSKHFTVKFKVEEVPIVSLFTRDNSSRAASGSNKSQSQKQQCSDEAVSDEKRFSKEVMQKYLKMVKPLYIRVSKRYGEKLGFSGQLSLGGTTKAGPSPLSTAAQKSPLSKASTAKGESEPTQAEPPPPPPQQQQQSNVKSQKQGNLPAGLRVVCKHLGKSRSASAAVAAAPSGSIQTRRRDDSLLQQQDGIQSAILHCKKSFNSSRDSDSSSLLSRSVSDTSHDKSNP